MGASLLGKWDSDELVPSVAQGTYRDGVEEPERHSSLSYEVRLCLWVPKVGGTLQSQSRGGGGAIRGGSKEETLAGVFRERGNFFRCGAVL